MFARVLYFYLSICLSIFLCDVVLYTAAFPKQSCPSQVEEIDSAEDRTCGQRCGLSTQRTLPDTAGEVRGVTKDHHFHPSVLSVQCGSVRGIRGLFFLVGTSLWGPLKIFNDWTYWNEIWYIHALQRMNPLQFNTLWPFLKPFKFAFLSCFFRLTVPRGKERATLAAMGMTARITIDYGWSANQMESRLAVLFRGQFAKWAGQRFSFTYLQVCVLYFCRHESSFSPITNFCFDPWFFTVQ